MSASPVPPQAAAALTLGADIIDSIDVPIIAVGTDCVVSRFNAAAATLLSLTLADLGRPIREIPVLTTVKRLEELCGEATGSGVSSQCEVRDATSGSWFLLRIAPYIGTEQRTAGAVLTLQNVTGFRASLEQAIHEREYTKAIINTVIDPLVVLDDDCRVQAANQAFYTKFQVSRDQAQGTRLYDIGGRDWEIPRLQRFLKETNANDQSDAEFEHEFSAIGHRTVLLNARRLSQRGNDGQMILVVIQDITERKQREEARRHAEAELRDFVETAAIGMHWVGPDGNILWANQTELALLGYTREEYVGHHIAEFHANLRVVDDILARLSRGESLHEYPARLRGKDGLIRHVLITSSVLFDGDKFVHTRCFTRDITEQVRAEEQRQASERTLRENERRFREMIDALPVAIYTTDAQGRLTHFNPAAVEFSGRVPELGTDQWCISWKLFCPDGTPMAHDECPMAVALREGRIVRNVEAIAERPDGTRIAFVPYPTPLRDAEGRIVGGINMLLDITERKQVERATALLAAIVDYSDDAIISKGLDGVITSWNKGAERIFGYRAEEAVGQHITLLIPQDRRDEEADILQRLRRGERIEHFDTVRVTKDGKLVDISLSISPVKDAQGRVMGASKVARVVTERKQAERTLAESEERFRTLFASAPMAVFVCDRNAVIQHYNRRAVELWGREPVCGVEQHCGSLKLWLPNGTVLPHQQTPMVEVLRTGIPALNVEVFIERPDGSRLPVLVNFAPLKNAQGEITGAITSFVDITDRKEAETALRESEERFRMLADQLDAQVKVRTVQLERRNVEVLKQSEQLRELSHRLIQTQDNERRHIARELHDSAGQILAALGMNLADVARQARQNAPRIVKAAEDGEQLVQQLSQEIRTMSYLLHPPLLDENGLPEALRWYTQGLTQRSGLDISFNIADDFGRLSCEMELVMFRLVQECLTNVHRHSGCKNAAIRIAREAETVSVEVQDYGSGILPEKLVEIQSQGSGVGIAGMRERVRQFEGDLSIQSNGTGTTVRVTFPVPKTVASPVPKTASPKLETIVQQVQATG